MSSAGQTSKSGAQFQRRGYKVQKLLEFIGGTKQNQWMKKRKRKNKRGKKE